MNKHRKALAEALADKAVKMLNRELVNLEMIATHELPTYWAQPAYKKLFIVAIADEIETREGNPA